MISSGGSDSAPARETSRGPSPRTSTTSRPRPVSRLPVEYRAFALIFGPGTLGVREWTFKTPGFPGAGRSVDLAELNGIPGNRGLPNRSDAELSEEGDPALIRRLVQFCSGGFEGDQFFWDPADVTDPEKNEYAIYIRGGELEPRIQRVATTFRELVMDYLLGGGYERHNFETRDRVARTASASEARVRPGIAPVGPRLSDVA